MPHNAYNTAITRPESRLGFGVPLLFELGYGGTLAANALGLDLFQPFAELLSSRRGVITISEVQVYLSSAGTGTAGSSNIFVNVVDSNGTIITNLATFNVAYNAHAAGNVDLTLQGGAYELQAGYSLRLDTGSLGTFSVYPSGLKVRLLGSIMGVNG